MNPYTGVVAGAGSATARTFLRTMMEWHRWLGWPGAGQAAGRAVTGACNAAFLVLAVTGIFIWWPKSWTPQHVQPATRLQSGLRGKAREWNWHNVVGLWSAPALVVLTFTGLTLSYTWAGNLLYLVTGNRPPSPARSADTRAAGESRAAGTEQRAGRSFDELWEAAAAQAPGWQVLTMRLPEKNGSAVTFSIVERDSNRFQRSTLVLDRASGAAVRWEPYRSANAGRKLRIWARFAHTGEAGGLLGQLVAFFACLGGGVLVFTGMALAVRRLAAWLGASARQLRAVWASCFRRERHPTAERWTAYSPGW